MELYNYFFKFKDSEGHFYQLRQEKLVAAKVLYRSEGSKESYTETSDFNIDESQNALWVRLPALGKTEIAIQITVEPLRNICTPLTVIDLVESTTTFTMSATPTPVYSLQGFSPRIIDGYWYEFDDETQTFRNTYVKAEATIIKEGTVVDVIEQGNPNPISSGGVWNFYNNQQIFNDSTTNNITNITNRLNDLELADPYTIILNDRKFGPNYKNEIDLGYIDFAPNTHWLKSDTRIGDIVYGRGTQVDDNNVVYSTDSFYRDECDTKQENNKSHFILFTLRPGWYRIQYQVYTTTTSGDIYVYREGERGWNVVCTTKGLADQFGLYYSSAVSSPDLVIRASSGYYIGRFSVMSDQNVRISRLPLNLSNEDIVKMKYFLVDYEQDTITIESNNYQMKDLVITNFIIDTDGAVSVSAPATGIGRANNFEFTATQDLTKIVFNDGINTIESDFFDTGTRAELVYVSPDDYSWNYYEDSSLQVKDVKVDGKTVVANRVAYLYSLTTAQITDLKSIFA